MKTIKYNNGDDFSFEEFEPKESNLIKINLNVNGADGEGIWACISDDNMDDYEKNVDDGEEYHRVAILRNDSINLNFPSWGMYIMYSLKGGYRPVCDLSKFDFSAPEFNLKETIRKD